MRKLLVIISGFLCACSGVSSLGKIGSTEFYSVHGDHFWGPNFTALVTKEEDQVKIIEVGYGPGGGHAIVGGTVQAAGQVGAAALYGHSLKFRKHHYNSNIDVSGGSASQNTKADAAASANSTNVNLNNNSSSSHGHPEFPGPPRED